MSLAVGQVARATSRDLVGAVAEAGERVADLGAGAAEPARRRCRRRRRGDGSTSGRSRRDFSSTSRRAAVFLPTPGTRHRAADVVVGQDPAQGVGLVDRQDGQGQRGPDAVRADQRLEAVPLVAAGEAVQRLRRPRARGGGSSTKTSAPTSPSRGRGERADRDPVADAAHLDQHLAGRRCGRASVPRSEPIGPISGPVAAATRWRIGAWARWQRASAAASAASAGRGGAARPSSVCTMRCRPAPCRAAPSPATACFTWFGRVLRRPRRRPRRASAMARPLAWPDRHGGAHVHLEEHPLDGDDVGPGLREQDPQLGLQLGQPLRAAGCAGSVRSTPMAVQRAAGAAAARRSA